MPHRMVSIGILVFWAIAAGSLLSRDVLPDLLIGAPPDMRSVTSARVGSRSTRWAIQVANRTGLRMPTSIGQVTTKAVRQKDGWVEMSSRVWFDSADLLLSSNIRPRDHAKIEIISVYEIDPGGDLRQFRASVRPMGVHEEWLVLSGVLKPEGLEVRAHGILKMLEWTKVFPYPKHGLVLNSLDPLDRMPGLQIGQRWRSQVVSPLTGQFQTVSVEVARRQLLEWNSKQVEATEVITRMEPFAMRTWVRRDGLVIRQEAPFALVTLILERLPDPDETDGEAKHP